jgi:predicted metal-dependent phosphoesterase TrpH
MDRGRNWLLAPLVLVALTSACHRRAAQASQPLRAAHRARVHRATRRDELPRGPYAVGRIGDVVLENRFIRAVVDDVRQGGGFALSGGQLVDLATVDGIDELGQVFNFLGRFPRQLRYRSMRIEELASGEARVVVEGTDPRTPGLEGTTVYSLGPDDRAITLTTTLRNRGTEATDVGLGDAVQWSGAEHWIPGIGFRLPRQTDEPFVGGLGRHSAYVYLGEHALTGPNGSNWSNPTQGTVTLARGAEVRYTRRIGVAGVPDLSRALEAARGVVSDAGLVVHVRDATGAPVSGVRVTLREHDANGAPKAMATTDDRGDARAATDPGSYAVEVSAPGRLLDAATRARLLAPVTLARGRDASLDVGVGNASTLTVTLRENGAAIPGRIVITGLEETASPNFGGVGHADGARNNVVVGVQGTTEFPLAPGRYRIVATHGPAYDLADSIVTLAPSTHETVTLELHRVLAFADDACGDFHVHQSPSLDAPVALRDRVRAAAAEGLDVIAATDHNVATDLGPAVRAEGLEHVLHTMVGDEVSTDAALHPSGHWNLYPIAYGDDAPLGGAPDLFELSPRALVERARAVAPGAIVQVNHPRSGAPTGMFDVVGFDASTARATRGDMAPSFDAVEVWNGRFADAAENVLRDWLALLRDGARITGTANSDSHGIVVQEIGYPRTCFHAARRGAPLTDADVVHALRDERDVVMTDGPMIAVSAPGLPRAIGHLLPATSGAARLSVRVEAASWVAPDRLEIVHSDGRAEPVRAEFRTEGGRVTAEVVVSVPRVEPFVLLRVRGSERIGVLIDDPPLYPLAITNPIYLAP